MHFIYAGWQKGTAMPQKCDLNTDGTFNSVRDSTVSQNKNVHCCGFFYGFLSTEPIKSL